MDLFGILFNVFYMLIDLANNLYGFLFTEVTIGSVTFVPFYLIGSATLVTLLVLYLVSTIVPLA